jgi:hypothetical protein
MVKEAGVPAVARDRPCPLAVDTAPEVRAGKTVAWKGDPATCVATLKRRLEGTVSRERDALSHSIDIWAFPMFSLYCILTS